MAKGKEIKTNVMRILEAEGIPYQEHTYSVEDGLLDGVSVAKKCGQNVEQVFKTLVTRGNDGQYYVFVVPVEGKLDLKAAAAAVHVKSVAMIAQKELFPLTGYVHGGCSPIGMKKQFVTVFDETCILFDTIMVSGGKIGVQVEVEPNALISLVQGRYADIARAS